MSENPRVLDLKNAPPNHIYTAKIEPQESDADRNVRLFKDVMLFIVALCFVIVIAALCVRSLLLPTTQPEEKKWAMSILAAAAGGMIGYLAKK